MGTTFSSIHIYSPHMVSGFPDFHSFSEGWQTYIPKEEQEDPFAFQKLAKKISRTIDTPVLWFYIFDSELLLFEFYKNGKKVAAYSQMNSNGCKNLYGIPSLIGYESGQKHRLSKILSCADIDFELALLEEFFGVCLIPIPEMLEESPDLFSRVRGEALYQAYLAEEKKLTGKQSPVKVTLVSEQRGKLFGDRFDDKDKQHIRPHHFYFGYDTFEENAIHPVRFEQGKLVFISQDEFDAAPKVFWRDEDERFSLEFYPSYKVHFTDKAPAGLKNKTLATPRGFYFSWFDDKGRAILTNDRGGIAVVDDSMKIIAKMNVKGTPVDFVDGYILTADSESGFAYYYNPTNFIRVYRMHDQRNDNP